MSKYKLHEENGKQVIERLVFPRFKGEITFSSTSPSDIENIEMIDECADAMELARAMRSAGEFLMKGHQINGKGKVVDNKTRD